MLNDHISPFDSRTDYADKGNAVDEICLHLARVLDMVPHGRTLVREKNGESVQHL